MGPGRVGSPMASPVLPPPTRHSQTDLSKGRGSLERVRQRFPPRQGNGSPRSDTFFSWVLGSNIRYAQSSPPPGIRSNSQDLVSFCACTVSIEENRDPGNRWLGPSPSFRPNWESLLPTFCICGCWGSLCYTCIPFPFPTPNCMSLWSSLQDYA